jgi:alpha-amylase
MVYSGQEMPNHKRLEFFDKDVIEWTGKYELHDFYKTLLSLHTSNPALRGGDTAVNTYLIHTNTDTQVMAYLRKNESYEVLVLLNLSGEPATCNIFHEKVSGHYTNVFTGETINANEVKQFALHCWGYHVFEKVAF